MNLKNGIVFQLTPIVDGRPAMNGTPALKGIMDLDGLPGAVRYGLAKSMRAIRPIFEDVERCRVELIRKHAIRDSTGNLVAEGGQFQMSDPVKFGKEFQELMEVNNEIAVHQVAIDGLVDAPGLTGRHLETLLTLGIVKDGDEPDATD